MSSRPNPYEFFEIDLRSGDFMHVLDTIEKMKKWAIVQYHFVYKNNPRFEIYVNGEKVDEAAIFDEAQEIMQKYLQGSLKPPE